jgi:hypothetical protein
MLRILVRGESDQFCFNAGKICSRSGATTAKILTNSEIKFAACSPNPKSSTCSKGVLFLVQDWNAGQTNHVDLSTFPAGLYLVQLLNSDRSQAGAKQFIKS